MYLVLRKLSIDLQLEYKIKNEDKCDVYSVKYENLKSESPQLSLHELNKTQINQEDKLGSQVLLKNEVDVFQSAPTHRKSKCKRKLELVVVNMSKDYKYEFFIRFGLQMFLDACIFSSLNLCDLSFDNWIQLLAYGVSAILLVRNSI